MRDMKCVDCDENLNSSPLEMKENVGLIAVGDESKATPAVSAPSQRKCLAILLTRKSRHQRIVGLCIPVGSTPQHWRF